MKAMFKKVVDCEIEKTAREAAKEVWCIQKMKMSIRD